MRLHTDADALIACSKPLSEVPWHWQGRPRQWLDQKPCDCVAGTIERMQRRAWSKRTAKPKVVVP